MMFKISLSPEAQSDLFEISAYIAEELNSPQAANRILVAITKRIRTLETLPLSGALLNAICGFDTAYRYLTCDNYLVFYRVEDTHVLVVRILYGKRDYLQLLFGGAIDGN